MDAVTGGGLVDEGYAVDVDAVAVDGTEAEGVARAPARRDDVIPHQKLLCKSCRYPRTIFGPSHTIADASTRYDGRL